MKGTSRIFRWPRKKSLKILLKRPDYICFALGMFFIETGKMTFNPFVVPFAVEYIGNEVITNLNSHCTVLFADAVKCSKLFATTLIHIWVMHLFISFITTTLPNGGVAQMVERSLSMREVPGSIPGISRLFS